MRERTLLSLMKWWQSLLGLSDWRTALHYVGKGKLKQNMGECVYWPQDRTAKIYVERGQPDPEATLIHELLHLWTRAIREGKKADLVEEQAIEALTRALLALKRGTAK